ncbi:MAG: hypothetical protein R8P61_01460 [Bacteroidia bacterium]|nr:hypothetical protein [Bacteroidia bacterium]
MTILILATAIMELLAGLALFFAPDKVPDFKEAPSSTITWGKMYGAAAFTAGVFAILTYLSMDPAVIKIFLQTFMVFHVWVGLAALLGYKKGDFANPGIAILHAVFAVITIYFYTTTL